MTEFRDSFPCKVREIANQWIPLPDGTRLAARIWLPAELPEGRVPAILEFIPYRKRDGMALRDEMMHPWFAGHGYAAVRVDLRGTGDSEGVFDDEYAPQEQQDGLAVIDWLSRQPWCSGSVGMIGISWGGFNGLQIAAHRPPALRAIVTVGSTDDRYADDVHYMGGAQLTANFTWAQTFFADLSRPPDPIIVGHDWRRMWLERLDRQQLLIGRWMAHPTRDAYWKHGSVCEDYGAITCAVLAVGGWADSYTNSVLRLLGGLKSPRLGIIGPWGHDYPHTAVPGPQIGFLQECLRWWDHWLKGRSTGIMEEPLLRLYLQHGISPDPTHRNRPGEWVALGQLPDGQLTERVWSLSSGTLTEVPCTGSSEQEPALVVDSLAHLGAQSGEWCAYGQAADQPGNQASDDGLSLVFDSEILTEAVEVIGTPRIRLTLTPLAKGATVIVRLNAVDAAGRSARITWGVRDLTLADDFETTRELVPGAPVRIDLPLCDTAYRFAPGDRIRIAVSSTYWPTVWVRPGQGAFLIHPEGCALVLPRPETTPSLTTFAPAEAAQPNQRETLRLGKFERNIYQSLASGTAAYEVLVDDGETRIADLGLTIGRICRETYLVSSSDPGTAQIDAEWTMTLARGDWRIRTESRSRMRRTEDGYEVVCKLEAFDSEERVFQRDYRASFSLS